MDARKRQWSQAFQEKPNASSKNQNKSLLSFFSMSDNSTTKKPTGKNTKSSSKLTTNSNNSHKNNNKPLEQLHLNPIGSSTTTISCRECGMTYTKTSSEDISLHKKFHRDVVQGMPYPGWKSDTVVVPSISIKKEKEKAKLIMVQGGGGQTQQRKINELLENIDRILSLPSLETQDLVNGKLFLIILNKRVIGLTLACPITMAYRVIDNDNDNNNNNDITKSDHKMLLDETLQLYCTRQHAKARVGLYRIFVTQQYRRRGLASLMLDTILHEYLPTQSLSKSDIAFGQPTNDCVCFAKAWSTVDNNKSDNGYWSVFTE